MSLDVVKLEKDLCRCCHSQGKYKSLYAPYFWQDIEEVVYYVRLQECFGVELAPVTQPSYRMLCSICDACIKKLQDAAKFKRQVLECEKVFKEKYLKEIEYPFNVDIKNEIDNLDANVASIIAGGSSCKTECDDGISNDKDYVDEDSTNYEDEKDFRWSDEDELPLQPPAEEKPQKTKKAPAKKKKKAPAKKKIKPPEEVVDVIKGNVKVVRPPLQRLVEGKHYTRVNDVLTCCKCDETFEIFDQMRYHIRNEHEKEAKNICTVCSEKFLTIRALHIHKIEEHNKDDRFKCNACDKAFIIKVNLKKHMNHFHKLGVWNKCNLCDFGTYYSLKRHMQCHKTEKDFNCSYCPKSFKRQHTLNFHERIHKGDKRKACNECGQTFVQKASLNYHMAKHHPDVKF